MGHPRVSLGFRHANYLANLLPHMLLQGQTTAELWTSTKPSLSKLTVWGCVEHVLATTQELRQAGGKLAARTIKCAYKYWYLGSNPHGRGWTFWNGSKVIYSSNAVFPEHLFYTFEHQDQEPPRLLWEDSDTTSSISQSLGSYSQPAQASVPASAACSSDPSHLQNAPADIQVRCSARFQVIPVNCRN